MKGGSLQSTISWSVGARVVLTVDRCEPFVTDRGTIHWMIDTDL